MLSIPQFKTSYPHNLYVSRTNQPIGTQGFSLSTNRNSRGSPNVENRLLTIWQSRRTVALPLSLTALPGPAWVLLNWIWKELISSLYSFLTRVGGGVINCSVFAEAPTPQHYTQNSDLIQFGEFVIKSLRYLQTATAAAVRSVTVTCHRGKRGDGNFGGGSDCANSEKWLDDYISRNQLQTAG